MKRIVLVLVFLGIFSMIGCSKPKNPEAEAHALAEAEAWLALVDSGKYAESWDEAAGFFRGAVPKEQWVQTMNAARKPFGENISRKLKSKRYRTSLPGAPMLDRDGTWRVSGYYMK